ncbi:DsrE family protein [Spiroplasma chinense]|uniref:DsrE family protein n=1 Tax=Spiroplasma chinense TaxID=216932 RepID=UPI0014129A97|nr:DsrE family protein [Spiroplasma chinense]
MSKNVILLTDTIIGTTEEKSLGEQLLTGFLYSLCNLEEDLLPSHIILYSNAALLVNGKDQILDHFKELESKKVDIIICGACVEFFKLEKIPFGRVSNMYEIVEIMSSSAKVIRP